MGVDRTILKDLISYYSVKLRSEDTNFHFLRTHLNLGLNGITLPVSFYFMDIPITIKEAYCGELYLEL